MFSGLVEAQGDVVEVRDEPPGRRLTVTAERLEGGARVGDSLAVNGCCLTVAACQGARLAFDVGPETLRCTNLGELSVGGRVNLERSLQVGDRLGGHFVTGHVDGLGTVADLRRDGEWVLVDFRLPPELSRYVARKGSIAVDGVSLTVADLTADGFRVMLIPHTLAVTSLGSRRVGDRVNLEIDLVARYVERLVAK